MDGWVKIHRSLADHELWTFEPFTYGQAWVDLLLLANHKPGIIMVRGIPVKVGRGQVGWSELSLAKRWKWSRGKVRRWLGMIWERGMVDKKQDNKTSVITILNYEKFQSENFNDGTSDGTADGTADGQQTDTRRYTNKNDKNEKNGKKEERGASAPRSPSKKFSPPSESEVQAYCRERGNSVNATSFVAFYESKGWMVGRNPMKDWRGAVRTWEQRDNGGTLFGGGRKDPTEGCI